MTDRSSLSRGERAARRKRVARRRATRIGMSGHEYWDRASYVGDVLTVSRDGVTYRMHDPGGIGRIAKTLRTGNPVEPAVLDDMRSLGLTGRAVDVGGGVGNHALWLAVACGLAVDTFEPRLAKIIAANIRLNSLPERVTLHPVALGQAAGSARWASRQRGRLNADAPGDIEVRTLDSYQFTDVSLIKVDVEGMEAAVIRGGLDTIARCRPVIYAEAWDKTWEAAIGALLEPLGYAMARRMRWKQRRWDPQ